MRVVYVWNLGCFHPGLYLPLKEFQAVFEGVEAAVVAALQMWETTLDLVTLANSEMDAAVGIG